MFGFGVVDNRSKGRNLLRSDDIVLDPCRPQIIIWSGNNPHVIRKEDINI